MVQERAFIRLYSAQSGDIFRYEALCVCYLSTYTLNVTYMPHFIKLDKFRVDPGPEDFSQRIEKKGVSEKGRVYQ